ncbi:hypothetical protein GCM10009740_34810 [Terrabacter terrae]|uniref:Uncharacterized protein n=1 Tax=Terrabacter terrae TaxID=318434 RepID=A0ABP5G2P2_9MICO
MRVLGPFVEDQDLTMYVRGPAAGTVPEFTRAHVLRPSPDAEIHVHPLLLVRVAVSGVLGKVRLECHLDPETLPVRWVV